MSNMAIQLLWTRVDSRPSLMPPGGGNVRVLHKAAKEALPYVRARDLPGAPACFMHAAAVRVLNEISSD